METLIYILKVNIYITLFYVCYYILLRRHTFFRLNRLYLVGTLFLSLVVPFVEFTETVRVLPTAILTLPEPSVHLAISSPELQIRWLQLILVLYGLGVVYMLSNLMRGFYGLYLLLKQGDWIEMESYTLILLPEIAAKNPGSFSFLNFLVVSHQDYENCFDTILLHEQVHIMQRHSYDILFVEVLKASCWFNPAIWFYKYSLREIHEFLADQQAENKEIYASFLVSYAQESEYGSITNNFYNSILLKDRIKMIYSNSTSYWSLAKYVLIIPIMTFAVIKTAAHNQVFINALPEQVTKLSKQVEKSHKKSSQGSFTKFNNKTKSNPATYIVLSSKSKPKKKVSQNVKTSVLSSGVVHQDTLWENYRPKHSTYDYYNRVQKMRKITLLLPTLDKFGNAFDKSLNLSKQTPPATEMPNSRVSLSDITNKIHLLFMKNSFFTLGLILVHYISYAQTNTLKIGYTDQVYIYNNLPEYKVFNNEMEVSAAKYQNILKEKYTLYQQKIDMYEKDVKNQVANAVLKDKESELQNLQKSIQDFQANSESDLKLMYQKKFSPIKEKVDNSINQYGKENGYTYILRLQTEENVGETWPILLYANDPTGDVSKGVLLKLGVSSPSIGSQNKVGLSVGLKK